jgi:ATP-binding cassette subfamily B protein/ATP-binding cassette subfamily B multidrug efflux pump
MGSFKLIEPFIQKYKLSLIIYTICMALSYPLESIIIPEIFSSFFESLKNTTYELPNDIFINFFFKIGLFIIIIITSQSIISLLDIYLIPEFNEMISNTIFEKIIKHYENNYTDLELGKILTRINGLPSTLREVTNDLFNWVAPKILTIIIINYYFFINDKILGLLSISILGILFWNNYNAFEPCIELSHNRYINFEDKSENLQDKLSNLYSIYSAGNVDNEIDDFNKITNTFKKIHRKSMLCTHKLKNNNNFITSCILIILSSYIIYLYKINKIEKTKLITLFMILLFYIPCLNTLITYLPDYTNHLGIIKSVDIFIDTIHTENLKKPDIIINKGTIKINNLNFGYTKDKYLFTNFNINIYSNEKVGLIGPSGNGKSSLIKILMGYYNVDDNTILIDDQDINKFNLNSLRKQITYINQNTKLFNKTIFENIKYGNNITNEQIINIYNKYNLQRIFNNIPNGFDTIVGVNGDSLSGGQKQIILLLRNYFKFNKICILDEPTSALDNETRETVINIIKDMSINSTLIIITHDINNLELINRKVKIENGKIISDKN